MSAFGFSLVMYGEGRDPELSLILDAYVEEKLVKSCCDGEKQAYSALVRAYSRYVFVICFGIVGNVRDAEDLAQQAFLKGFVNIKKLRGSRRFKLWIAKIARNLCIDFLRKQKIESVAIAERLADEENCSNESHSDLKEYSKLEAALAKLEDKYRLPLVLYYLNGRSTVAIADEMRISRNGVQARLSRARKQLRTLLNAEEI